LNQRIFGVPIEEEPAFDQNRRCLFELLLERLNITDATRQSPAGVISVTRVQIPAHVRSEQDRERRPVVRAKPFVQAQFVVLLRRRSSHRLKRQTRNSQQRPECFTKQGYAPPANWNPDYLDRVLTVLPTNQRRVAPVVATGDRMRYTAGKSWATVDQ